MQEGDAGIYLQYTLNGSGSRRLMGDGQVTGPKKEGQTPMPCRLSKPTGVGLLLKNPFKPYGA